MKKVYKALALAASLFVGSLAGYAQHWKYDDQARVEAGSIQAGVDYALLPSFAVNTGGFNFLAGERFTDSHNLVAANLYQFVEAGSTATGDVMYYLRRKSGEYVAVPTNGQFYTNQVERAWKLVVKPISYQDATHQWQHQEVTVVDGVEKDTIITYTGINAYLWEARDNEDTDSYDFSTMSFTDSEGAVVLVDPVPAKENDPYSLYNFFLTYPSGNPGGAPGKGDDYARNSWVIYATEPMEPLESLEAVLQELFKGENLADRLRNYRIGDDAGEYNAEKYNTILELWTRATAIVENSGADATADEMNSIANELPGAYEAFITSGKPLTAGYYIVYSMRPNGDIYPSGKPAYPYGRNGNPGPDAYDDGAIYDGSAVDPADGNLRWSYLKTDAVNFTRSEIDNKEFKGEHAKFVWKVTDSGTKDNAGNPLYYFQNVETQKYIGKDPKTFSPIVMTAKPEVAYTIAASKEHPGYFNFYSPALTKATEQGAPTPAEYSGMHASSDVNNVVAWDWRVGGSCWQVIAVTEAEIETMLELAAPAKRLATLEALVKKSEDAIAAGKVYMGVDDSGNKIEHAASGQLGAEVDGLVTTADQLFCPMFDSQEGTNIGAMLDGDLGSIFHSTWHGGSEAWTKNHFLQMQLAQPEKDVLIKWVKRNGSNNNGSPLKVVIWGSNSTDDEVLQAGKAEVENEDGTVTTNFDAWKEKWDSITVGSFTYPYEITWTNGNKIANAVGTARFELPEKYKYIRMEVITRVADGDKPSGNKYFHAAEIRVYRAAYDPSASIYEAVPADVKEEINNAIAAAKAVLATGAASQEEVDALQAAYDKFMNNYPDPAKVTKAIAAAKTLVTAAEEGEGLGYYATGAKDAANTVIASVETKLNKILNEEKRQPNVTEVNNLLAELNAGLTEFNDKLQVPATGIYAVKSYSSNNTVAGRRITANNSSRKSYVNMVGRKQVGSTWTDDPIVEDKLGAYWEVTKVEGGYTYKNLFTGLYLAPYTEDKSSRMVTQSEQPYVFGLEFAKVAGAFNLVAKKEDVLNEEHVFVNAQPGGSYTVVLWNAASGRDNSAFTFEPVEEKVLELLDAGFLYDVPAPGKAQIMTFPIALENTEDFYTVIGQDADNKIQLKEVTGGLEAGQAYVYKPSSDEALVVLYPVAKTVAELAPTVKEAQPVNGLVPTFETIKIQEQNGRFDNTHSQVLLSEVNESVAANTGYFTLMPVAEEAGDAFIPANGKITSIDNLVVITKSADKGVYTIAGVRVKNVNSLPAGLYIVNGQKVLVK